MVVNAQADARGVREEAGRHYLFTRIDSISRRSAPATIKTLPKPCNLRGFFLPDRNDHETQIPRQEIDGGQERCGR